jgi:hypothetical protein
MAVMAAAPLVEAAVRVDIPATAALAVVEQRVVVPVLVAEAVAVLALAE